MYQCYDQTSVIQKRVIQRFVCICFIIVIHVVKVIRGLGLPQGKLDKSASLKLIPKHTLGGIN